MWQVYGQDHLLKQLEPSLKQDRLAHAYLLVGPPHVGKMALALGLARAVNCVQGPGVPCGDCSQCRHVDQGRHADVRVVGVTQRAEGGPTRTVIGISEVKESLHQANLKPFEGSCTVIIFDGVEAMSIEAANALLKTLEEPPPQVLLLLLTANEDALLSTTRSRCRRLALLPVAREQMVQKLVAGHGASTQSAQRLALLSRGCFGWAITALNDPQVLERREADLAQIKEVCESGLPSRFDYANELSTRFLRDRDSVKELLYLWLRWWRDLILIKEGAEEYVQNPDEITYLRLQATQLTTRQIVGFVKGVNQTLEALDHNANARLALEVLMLNLPGGNIRA
jgi:DNA polymerase-3 subunit delta'